MMQCQQGMSTRCTLVKGQVGPGSALPIGRQAGLPYHMYREKENDYNE